MLLPFLQSFNFIPYGFWGDDFWIFFHKFSIPVAMATNTIQRSLDKDDTFDRGLLEEHFCKSLVKISALR